MWKYILEFNSSSRETKWFILTSIVYGLLIAISLVYCYARLDFVRSNKPLETHTKL